MFILGLAFVNNKVSKLSKVFWVIKKKEKALCTKKKIFEVCMNNQCIKLFDFQVNQHKRLGKNFCFYIQIYNL